MFEKLGFSKVYDNCSWKLLVLQFCCLETIRGGYMICWLMVRRLRLGDFPKYELGSKLEVDMF